VGPAGEAASASGLPHKASGIWLLAKAVGRRGGAGQASCWAVGSSGPLLPHEWRQVFHWQSESGGGQMKESRERGQGPLSGGNAGALPRAGSKGRGRVVLVACGASLGLEECIIDHGVFWLDWGWGCAE
jgi:hypothetical protein